MPHLSSQNLFCPCFSRFYSQRCQRFASFSMVRQILVLMHRQILCVSCILVSSDVHRHLFRRTLNSDSLSLSCFVFTSVLDSVDRLLIDELCNVSTMTHTSRSDAISILLYTSIGSIPSKVGFKSTFTFTAPAVLPFRR